MNRQRKPLLLGRENGYDAAFLREEYMPTLIDLSQPLEHGQPNFPYDPKITVLAHNTIASIGYNITQISMATHQGTHLDVPYHFYDDGMTVDQVPLERFYGPAVLIDLAPGSHLAARTPITPEMLQPHADKFQPGAKVIYRTGWDRTFGAPESFTDFPTLTLAATHWIVQRRIGLLGMDTLTPSTEWKEVHMALLAKGVEIVIVEGLTNLDILPERFTFVGFPLNIKGRDGSPIRAVAVVEN
jgi:arylformamidase